MLQKLRKMLLVHIVTLLFLTLTFGKGDVIYPKKHENQELATRIYCQVQEPQHFHYSSITELWGMMGGQIILDADIRVRCIGDDQGGKFESDALKYRVQINNLQLTEKKVSNKESLIRHRRGAGEFFTRSWDQIKQFFKRVFRRRGREPDPPKPKPTEPTDEPRETPTREDLPEDFVISDSMYSAPFQFLQFANGSIPEIRFTENEIDNRVKNFKRHLVDAFSTHLNSNKKHDSVVEKSIMGEHTSTYDIKVNNPAESLTLAGFGIPVKVEEPTVVVKKLVTEGDILRLAPSEALNDREKMNIKVEQMQIFQGGRMISSSGFSSLILLPGSELARNRVKREEEDDDEEDITSHLQTHSTFDIQLQVRERRSTRYSAELESDDTEYVPASRIAEQEVDSKTLKFGIPEAPTMDASAVFEHLLSGNNTEYDEKMQIIFETVKREVSMKKDKENGSVSSTLRKIFSREVMQEFCARNFSLCKDFLQLLALAGGSEAETVLLAFLTQQGGMSIPLYHTVADIISEIAEPSSSLLHSLGDIIRKNSESASEALGVLCLSLGHLASKSSAVEDKVYVSNIFRNLLKAKKSSCRSDVFVIDLLEAISNLGSQDPAEEVLEVSSLCKENMAVQIACAHALRHSVHLPRVQNWIINATTEKNCDLIREVVGSLTDKIRDQEMNSDKTAWPRYDFNSIDRFLKNNLINESPPCSNLESDILLYFGRKRDPEANEVSRNFFDKDSGRADEQVGRLRRRAIGWDDLNCGEWTEDSSSRFNPIQDSEEFAADRATYNRRKSCLAFRKVGVKGANAQIYAGMFAGVKEPSDPPKYKLFTKFVSGLNFLGHEMEIGSFYFYHQSGKTKAYVRILGRTRQEFTNEGCTPTDLKYRPLKHIPLYMMNVGTVQLSLGVHLSSQLAMDTICPGEEVYQLEPFTNVRVGGEAMGSVLFARGAVNLSGNFNYKLQFTFTPIPDMCIKGSHGYDPMHISFEAYYQLWNVAKDNWGKARTWKPNFLSWKVSNGRMKQWFDDTCIGTEEAKPTLNMEREME